MICQKCGAENKDGALFCENCGTSLSNHSETKLIKLHCKNCGGEMSIDPDASQITCPYCGEKQVLLDSDKVKIEKEKYKTIKEMQKTQYQEEQAKQDRLDKRDELLEYKKSKQAKFTLAAAVISFIMGISGFASASIFKGIGCLILFGLFLYAYLCGMQIVKEKVKNTKTLGVLAACLLLVVFSFTGCLSSKNDSSSKSSSSSSSETYEKLEWPTSGLATLLPKPSFKYGNVDSNIDSYFRATFSKASEKEYKNYVEECKNKGFTYDPYDSDTTYSAYTNEGYTLTLSYYDSDSEIDLYLYAPEQYAEFSWPSSSLASLIPEAKSHLGYVYDNTEEKVSIEIAETTLEEMGEYMNECIEMGFNVDYYKTDDYFQANDANGNSLMITKGGFNEMYVEITKAEEKVEETPVPTSESTSTDNNSNNDSVLSDVVTPSFKEMMDSYEAFFDEYIAFMEKYENSDDTSSMAIDYINIVSKELEWIDKIDAVDESTLTTADDLYYLEVTARVEKKLIDASLN